MEHLIPTVLGIAGALAPMALAYWKQERSTPLREIPAPWLPMDRPHRSFIEEAIVRGGRIYL